MSDPARVLLEQLLDPESFGQMCDRVEASLLLDRPPYLDELLEFAPAEIPARLGEVFGVGDRPERWELDAVSTALRERHGRKLGRKMMRQGLALAERFRAADAIDEARSTHGPSVLGNTQRREVSRLIAAGRDRVAAGEDVDLVATSVERSFAALYALDVTLTPDVH